MILYESYSIIRIGWHH
ncbi:peptidase S24-like family protein, partial [Vibrio parahaemolyticus IDH02640]